MRGKNSIISIVLVVCFIINYMPISVYANESDKVHWASKMFSNFEDKGYIRKTDESKFDILINRGKLH